MPGNESLDLKCYSSHQDIHNCDIMPEDADTNNFYRKDAACFVEIFSFKFKKLHVYTNMYNALQNLAVSSP